MSNQPSDIITRLKIETGDAATELEKLNAKIAEYKALIKEAGKDGKESFDKLAEVIKRTNVKDFEKAFEQLQENAKKSKMEAGEFAKAQSDLKAKYILDNKAMTFAVRELNAEQKVAAQGATKMSVDATTAAQQYRNEVERIKQRLMELSAQTKLSQADVGRGMVFAGEASAKNVATAIRELNSAAAGGQSAWAGLAKGVQYFFSAVLGLTAIQILRDVITFFTQATEAAVDFARATYQLEIGVRALQRAGIDITIKEMYENIDRLSEKFGIFSRVELVEGSAALANLMRDMGLTKTQIFELQEAIATLAVVNGRAMDEVQRTVALALSSGYTEGLQRLGVSINRVTIAEKAAQLGWEGGYLALTEQQRAYATYQLVLEKTALYQQDLSAYQETLPGQIDATNAAIKDQTVAVGSLLAPLDLLIAKIKLLGVTIAKELPGLKYWSFLIKNVMIAQDLGKYIGEQIRSIGIVGNAYKFWGGVIKSLTPAFDSIIERQQRFYAHNQEIIKSFWEQIPVVRDVIGVVEKYVSLLGELDASSLGDIKGKAKFTLDTEGSSEEMEKLAEDIDRLMDDIWEEQQRFQQRSDDAWIDYQNDLDRLQREWLRDSIEAWDDYQDKLDDIRSKAQQRYEDEEREYRNRIADALEQFALRRSEIERAYRDNEETAEAKFQEKMRQLREQYLMDLEDAVRERDARQIIRLMRRYNLEKKQATREEQLRKDDAARDFKRQLADLEAQKAARMAQLKREHEERMAEIETQLGREEAAAEEDYKRKKEDIDTKYDADKKEREIRYQEELADLAKNMQDRLNLLIGKLVREYEVTDEWMTEIEKRIIATYGPGGVIEKAILYARSLIATIPGLPEVPSSKKTKSKSVGAQAQGGTYYADTPTTALFGEAGPEIATFTPLRGRGGSVLAGPIERTEPIGFGRMVMEILLSSDLEYRIVDKAMDTTADFLMKVQRQKV